MAQSPNLRFKLVTQNQSQKEYTVNEALITLDALLNNSIISTELTSPPALTKDGDLYAVASPASGHWEYQDHKLAYSYQGSWWFITPKLGCTLWAQNKAKLCTYGAKGWD